MNNHEVEQRVMEILAKKLNVDLAKINGETRLAEDLNVDSFGAVELLFEIEEAFGLKIADSEIEQVRKVSEIVTYVMKYSASSPPSHDAAPQRLG